MKVMYIFHSLELIEKWNRVDRESKTACDLWFQIDTEGALSCTEAARNFWPYVSPVPGKSTNNQQEHIPSDKIL